jgi:hypothetical protein
MCNRSCIVHYSVYRLIKLNYELLECTLEFGICRIFFRVDEMSILK